MKNSVNGIHTSRGKMNDSICGKISGIQNKISASRAEFEEKMIDMLDRHCKGITAWWNSKPRTSVRTSAVRYKQHDRI
jgi:hypothetical protein